MSGTAVLELTKAPFQPRYEIERQKTWPVQQMDLERMRVWLMPRLQPAYPTFTDTQIANFLRSCIPSNDWLFICTENAVLLAQAVQPSMRLLRVDEEFCLCRTEECVDEAADLYRPLMRWAVSKGASKVIIDQLTDVTQGQIRYRIGDLKTKRVVLREIGD